ncbi:terminase large subunit domain-containing protein [Acidovorax sp. PRC11]|uniref:terminase large subunit domain-containing protein n=1 Tax=Acidovorax sp. PRC11 TaxID=2962592 RepID=UPI0028816C3E|nr:terminase family protein [Acidovorax sp. PRC11]MDT0137298.1 terminase family protein [Acidovorax sp. PRC11]
MTEAAATPTTSAPRRPRKRPSASAATQLADSIDGGASKRRDARTLFWSGWKLTHISEHLGVPRATLHGWHKAEKWAEASPAQRVEGALEVRLATLIAKDCKTGGDYKEIDLLGRQLERLARIGKYQQTGREVDLNPAIASRNANPKKPPVKNFLSPEQVQKLKDAFRGSLYDYQRVWWEEKDQRTRAILKSRQIGATWYFAREALIDALETGRNQIFLSASKAQAYLFRQYIRAFVFQVLGVELKGDPIVLANGAELYFLGSNARTAQGYHGNFYFDEFFWAQDFELLNSVASGMATHKKWRRTYFSTPSSIQHPAYKFWSGERVKKKSKIEVDITHGRLAGGFTGEDRMWRHIVTVIDALAGGCNLIDLDEVREERSDSEFSNLFMCEFLDDSHSVFPLVSLQPCMVDSWGLWSDFKPFSERPFGWAPVWVGYDPSHKGDSAGLVVVAPPAMPGGPLRVLHTEQFKGHDFEAQAKAIKAITARYNVVAITVDTTGIGQGVFQLVQKFFPAARGINYSVDSKTLLVLKAQQVIAARRLQFDAGNRDLAVSFMAIKRELTASGRNVTYAAGRSEDAGHADLAWACMNALSNEPLDVGTGLANVQGQSFLEISE